MLLSAVMLSTGTLGEQPGFCAPSGLGFIYFHFVWVFIYFKPSLSPGVLFSPKISRFFPEQVSSVRFGGAQPKITFRDPKATLGDPKITFGDHKGQGQTSPLVPPAASECSGSAPNPPHTWIHLDPPGFQRPPRPAGTRLLFLERWSRPGALPG